MIHDGFISTDEPIATAGGTTDVGELLAVLIMFQRHYQPVLLRLAERDGTGAEIVRVLLNRLAAVEKLLWALPLSEEAFQTLERVGSLDTRDLLCPLCGHSAPESGGVT